MENEINDEQRCLANRTDNNRPKATSKCTRRFIHIFAGSRDIFFHIITLANDDSIFASLEETILSVLHLAGDQILFCRTFRR